MKKKAVKTVSKKKVLPKAKLAKSNKPKTPTFMERILSGEDVSTKIDEFIDEWQFADPAKVEPILHNHLGMTSAEYRKFITNPASLPEIIDKRRNRSAN